MTKVFFDCEMTGLHKDTTLISIGLVSECGKEFYAELTDYDRSQVDEWVEENVLNNLMFNDYGKVNKQLGSITFVKGSKEEVGVALKDWFNLFDTVELWSDCHHYDVVLLQDFFGGAFGVPSHIYYIPFDICTLMKALGVDPDISREAFIDTPIEGEKHNSLYDARVIQACFEKLMRNKERYLEKN